MIAIAAEYFYYTMVVMLCLMIPHFCFFKARPYLLDWISRKYLQWTHGMVAFVVPWLLQPNHLPMWLPEAGLTTEESTAVQYLLLTGLALILWDCFYIYKEEVFVTILLNAHHLGVFIGIYFGPFFLKSPPTPSDQSTAEHITNLYAWLWGIHSVGFFVEVVIPFITGKKAEEGSRSPLVEVFKHGYSAITGYFMYQYYHAEGQLGLGWNYQTGAILTMVTGRYLINQNWKNIAFMRRVEVPLFCIIHIDALFFLDPYMERTIGAAVVLFATSSFYKVFIKKHRPRPGGYDGTDAEIKQLLKEERVRLEKEYPEAFLAKPSHTQILKWFDDHEGWAKDWPIFRACVASDFESLVRMLEEAPKEDGKTAEQLVNEKMTAWYDSTPLAWTASAHMDLVACTLILLEYGANPYHTASSNDVACPMDKASGLKRHAVLFEKLDSLALQKWPSKEIPWEQRGVWDRFSAVVGKM